MIEPTFEERQIEEYCRWYDMQRIGSEYRHHYYRENVKDLKLSYGGRVLFETIISCVDNSGYVEKSTPELCKMVVKMHGSISEKTILNNLKKLRDKKSIHFSRAKNQQHCYYEIQLPLFQDITSVH